jgi:hypothetical protein
VSPDALANQDQNNSGANYSLGFEPEEDDCVLAEIEATVRRMLSGLRRMRRYERAAAFRAARDWRLTAIKEWREKRARERHARQTLRRLQALGQRRSLDAPGH